jgi:hypothetical protein
LSDAGNRSEAGRKLGSNETVEIQFAKLSVLREVNFNSEKIFDIIKIRKAQQE